MEDAVRKGIGRRQPAAAVLETIRTVTERGWVVSVDLVCGLPGQTLRGLLDGILALRAAGVHGFSLYELLIYPQNRKWAEHFHLIERGSERDHRPNYFLFQAGAALLEEHGLRKNLFNHWADEQDQNVYFTFPQRGEDLLAAGTNADGVFGDYHYRHPIYADYLRDSTPHNPGLLGGLRRSARESRLFPYILAVQSGTISAEQARALAACIFPNGQPLLERWQTHGLLAHLPGGGFRLTSNGSWFAGNLIEELNAVME
jgi:coproporphyrinogen III oxidase-like Fe-S oxidoreductase